MELRSPDVIFVSGSTCQVVGSPKAPEDRATRQCPRPVAPPPAPDSDHELFTEPEEDGGPDTDHPDMFEELFGYKRKAGRPPGPNAATKAKITPARDTPDNRFVPKADGRSKAGKAAKAAKTAFTLGEKDITIRDMLDHGLFQAGEMNVSAVCKGVTCTASLTKEGDIVYEGTKFSSPGGFSQFIKVKLAHNRPGGDGWRYVHVHGISLHDWRCRMLGLPIVPSNKPGRPPKKVEGAAAKPSPDFPAAPKPVEPTVVQPPPAPPPPPRFPTPEPGQDVEGGRRANWVQCADCCQWRVVPDECWTKIEASDDHEWLCKDATWDVSLYEPHTPLCGQP